MCVGAVRSSYLPGHSPGNGQCPAVICQDIVQVMASVLLLFVRT